MIPHPYIAAQIADDRQREMVAAAKRHSLILQAKAARSAPRQARLVTGRPRRVLASAIRRVTPHHA